MLLDQSMSLNQTNVEFVPSRIKRIQLLLFFVSELNETNLALIISQEVSKLLLDWSNTCLKRCLSILNLLLKVEVFL